MRNPRKSEENRELFTTHPTVRDYVHRELHKAETNSLPNFTLPGFTAGTAETFPGSKEAERIVLEVYDALCDEAWRIANQGSRPGVFLGEVYGDMMRAIMAGDGDPTASRWPMGAGANALMVRYHTGKETVGPQDQVTHEFAAAYRHYHPAAMSVAVTGRADPRHRDMFKACQAALAACYAKLRPGQTVGELYEVHVESLTASGYGHAALKACGYSMGISYPPTWKQSSKGATF